ncbi:hypothetical protein LTR15_005686 [Elasticomyces elasticus]|nr:hypothetical protein LTR15_005686 [Elasticomyces elasticus]
MGNSRSADIRAAVDETLLRLMQAEAVGKYIVVVGKDMEPGAARHYGLSWMLTKDSTTSASTRAAVDPPIPRAMQAETE